MKSSRKTTRKRGAELKPAERMFVFIAFTQVMQAFMSYDGGATSLSQGVLAMNGWTIAQLGWLGAMDKFGQVATATLWGHFLLRCRANKLLLVFGVFLKASSCLGFGYLSTKWLMMCSKASMGISEALVGTWATAWVQGHAPRDSQSRWVGFANTSAGIGSGVGAAVAGLCSKRHGYAFAFTVQAVVLYILSLMMMCSPRYFFDFYDEKQRWTSSEELATDHSQLSLDGAVRSHSDSPGGAVLGRRGRIEEDERADGSEEEEDSSADEDASEEDSSEDSDAAKSAGRLPRTKTIVESPRFRKGIRAVFKNRAWFWTAMCISAVCYISQAVNYFWQNTCKFIWAFSDESATYSLLITTAGGGILGVVLGPKIFDGYLGGFGTKRGVTTCLRWVRHAAFAASLLALASGGMLLGEAYFTGKYPAAHSDLLADWPHREWLLVVMLVCVLLIFALTQGIQGTLYAINTDVMKPVKLGDPDLRPVAVALTQSMQNIFGFALGTLLPSEIAQFAGNALNDKTPPEPHTIVRSVEYSISMALAVLGCIPLLVAAFFATRTARRQEEVCEDLPLTT